MSQLLLVGGSGGYWAPDPVHTPPIFLSKENVLQGWVLGPSQRAALRKRVQRQHTGQLRASRSLAMVVWPQQKEFLCLGQPNVLICLGQSQFTPVVQAQLLTAPLLLLKCLSLNNKLYGCHVYTCLKKALPLPWSRTISLPHLSFPTSEKWPRVTKCGYSSLWNSNWVTGLKSD